MQLHLQTGSSGFTPQLDPKDPRKKRPTIDTTALLGAGSIADRYPTKADFAFEANKLKWERTMFDALEAGLRAENLMAFQLAEALFEKSLVELAELGITFFHDYLYQLHCKLADHETVLIQTQNSRRCVQRSMDWCCENDSTHSDSTPPQIRPFSHFESYDELPS
jgi:hypothetical protein